MGTIAFLSSQNAEKSDKLSKNVTDKILSATQEYRTLPKAEKKEKVDANNGKVRSMAHFSLFLLLGFLGCSLLCDFNAKTAIPIAFAWCALYALFDETFQKFLENGRAFEYEDLAKDCGGASLGIALAFALFLIIKRRRGEVK